MFVNCFPTFFLANFAIDFDLVVVQWSLGRYKFYVILNLYIHMRRPIIDFGLLNLGYHSEWEKGREHLRFQTLTMTKMP